MRSIYATILQMMRFIDIFLHLDKYLTGAVQNYGNFLYAILFLVIFCETGVVATPFLPGDSLLFAVGAIAASVNSFNIWYLFLVISVAAIIGDSVNYSIGNYLGAKAFANPDSKIFKKEYLVETEAFYEKYGSRAVVLGRFFPIIRTFIPFVAGVGKMNYAKFIANNALGGILWTAIFLLGGFFFGNIQIVKENFTLVIFGIIVLSIMPAFYHVIKSRLVKA